MHRNKIHNLAVICLLLLCAGTGFSEDSELVLGGKEGWPELQVMDGVVRGSGRFGYECIQLDTNSRSVESDTDLLLDFEKSYCSDVSGNYSVKKSSMIHTDKAKMGKGAALFRGTGGIQLSGKTGSLFGTSGIAGSFLMEFWLNPSIAENGEIVFSWRSSRTVDRYPLYQMITASFFNNHLQWSFTNVFDGYAKNGGEINLSGSRTIIPDAWTHHSISYDEETGLLEYRIDGKTEALMYVTTNGREHGGSIYSAVLGVNADIEVCPNYTGMLDDFRIQRNCSSETSLNLGYDTYRKNGGRFVTEPILISQGATLNRLDAIITEPEQTEVMLYVRSGDNYFNWTEDEPAWTPVENHKNINGIKGLYFQVAADLYPDGGGKNTPSITEIKINYTEVPDPLPPFTINAQSGDGQVVLSWSYSVDDTAGGYYVFYGERPGEYLGADASEGKSPIDVGNVSSITLTGLKNGKIYYFAVASYSRLDKRIMGILSQEVYARPMHR